MAIQIGRREFIVTLGGTAAAWPLVAQAQQPERMHRVAVLMGLAESDPEGQKRIKGLRSRLNELGWIENRNLRLDCRWAAGDIARTRALATELANSVSEVIVVNTPPGLAALREATSTIPIVFAQVTDVAESGITTPARPQANVTGFAHFYTYDVTGKWLSLLREIAPGVAQVGLMQNPDHPSWMGYVAAMEATASAVGLGVYRAPVNEPAEIDRALDGIAEKRNAGLIVLPDTFTAVHRHRIVQLANKHGIPAVYPTSFFATAGGLMSYGSDVADLVRSTGTYVDRILRGASPGELPVQTSTKYELVINLNTAKALGITVPPTLLARADEVIE